LHVSVHRAAAAEEAEEDVLLLDDEEAMVAVPSGKHAPHTTNSALPAVLAAKSMNGAPMEVREQPRNESEPLGAESAAHVEPEDGSTAKAGGVEEEDGRTSTVEAGKAVVPGQGALVHETTLVARSYQMVTASAQKPGWLMSIASASS
jgi:hypothetical protein